MPARKLVLDYVSRYPGIHVREIERRLGLPSRLAAYHLEQLEHEGQVQCIQEPGFARYFPAVGKPRWSRREMEFLCLMRHAVALRITVLLLSETEMAQGDIARRLDLAKASTSYHLALLVKAGLVEVRRAGRQRIYCLSEPTHVTGMLANFTPIPEDLDTFTGIWNDLFG
ncbi:MAG: MarR family transcriptional regulator [bacterium]